MLKDTSAEGKRKKEREKKGTRVEIRERRKISRASKKRTAKRTANSLPTWNGLLAEGAATLREVA